MRNAARFCLGMVLAAGCGVTATAQVKPFLLPADCADFALDPDTGTLAAVANDADAVLFFKSAAWQSGKMAPSATLAVGPAPMAIAFKRYKDRRMFVVGCARDASLFVCDADSGTLVKKIPLPCVGVTNIVASVNPDDPFVYYTYVERGPQSAQSNMAAISLARLEHSGTVRWHLQEVAISASGEVAYHRSPGSSPSGLRSLLRTSEATAETPVFADWSSEYVASDAYVPDPFDRFTASGRRIFTRSLEKAVAEVEFVPLCWFRTRPLLVGVVADDPNRIAVDPEAGKPRRAVLRAASANSFRPTNGTVMIELKDPTIARLEPPDSAAAGAVAAAAMRATRLRMFAYDRGSCVLYAWRSRLAVVPLADFGPVDEPFLAARLTGGDDLFVGEESVLSLTPADPRVGVRFDSLPDGMQVAGHELRWRPTAEQIGSTSVVARLTHRDIERTQTFDLVVRRPSVALPFAPLGCTVADDGRTAVIWDGVAPTPRAPHDPDFGGPGVPRMATIDVHTGVVRAEKRFPDEITRAVVVGDQVLLVAPDANRCDVHDLQTLKRKRTVMVEEPITGVGSCPGSIVLASRNQLAVFDATTLESRGRYANAPLPESPKGPRGGDASIVVPTMLTSRGLVIRGVLVDPAGKPALVFRPFASTLIPWGDAGHVPAWARSAMRPLPGPTRPAVASLTESGTGLLAGTEIHPNGLAAKLEYRMQRRAPSKSSTVSRWDFDLVATTTGDRPVHAILERQKDLPYSPMATAPIRAAVCVTQHAVCATFRNRLYRVPLPEAVGGQKAGPPTLMPRQSAVVLATDGPTTLVHAAEGGRPPLTFSLISPPAGMTIDAANGTVTVDRAKVVEQAARVFEKSLAARPPNGSYVEELRRMVEAAARDVADIIGRKTTGLPLLVPIHVAVTDADGAKDSLRYHVVAEIPEPQLVSGLQKLDEQRIQAVSQAARQPAVPPGTVPGSPPATPQPVRMPADDELLVRRVEALEQRLMVITRQLNDILKRLDK